MNEGNVLILFCKLYMHFSTKPSGLISLTTAGWTVGMLFIFQLCTVFWQFGIYMWIEKIMLFNNADVVNYVMYVS